mmetsp:Transcript_22185/g.51839  ORF Transcript_22185/g.51839 Transcript_22185/m.51839 type:complete len:200 (+) Transcript_22185:546-1145(+)
MQPKATSLLTHGHCSPSSSCKPALRSQCCRPWRTSPAALASCTAGGCRLRSRRPLWHRSAAASLRARCSRSLWPSTPTSSIGRRRQCPSAWASGHRRTFCCLCTSSCGMTKLRWWVPASRILSRTGRTLASARLQQASNGCTRSSAVRMRSARAVSPHSQRCWSRGLHQSMQTRPRLRPRNRRTDGPSVQDQRAATDLG